MIAPVADESPDWKTIGPRCLFHSSRSIKGVPFRKRYGAAKDEQTNICDSEPPDHIYDLAFARIANLGPLAIVVTGDEEPV
jgi:hypothetical protein